MDQRLLAGFLLLPLLEHLTMLHLTRRETLRIVGAAVGACWARPSLGAMDAEAPLARLALSRPEPGLVEAELFAVPAPVTVAGTRATLLTYNGSFPGPLLRLRERERVRLRFMNLLDEPTNLHLHGLHISPAVDDPFLSVPPGESALYEFTVPEGSTGTHWYHPHMHGHVAEQLFAGLAGPIVVTGRADRILSPRRVQDYVLVLKDLTLVGGAVEPHRQFDWMTGKEGQLVLVNGVVRPRLNPQRSVIRLRFVNASNARYYRLALEKHVLHLIATDGGLLQEPVTVQELLLAPGERAEVLVRLDRAGEFRLLNLPYDRVGLMMGHMPGTRPPSNQAQTLLTVANSNARAPAALPEHLGSVETIDLREAPVTRRLVLSETMMGARFLINGRAFDPNRVDLGGRVGDLEIWEIENRGRMDHPFHLHTYPFQIISRDGVRPSFTAWKDTVNVSPHELVRLAVPLRDFGGRTVYHCHIVEHEDRGMMGILDVQA